MAKYKVLQGGAGNTTVNGNYAFTLKTGDMVDGTVSGDGKFVLVALPYLAPKQSNPPQAKFKSKYLQLVPDAPVQVAPIVKSASATAEVKTPVKFTPTIIYPLIGLGAGSLGGFFVARQGKPTMVKYATWIGVLGVIGGATGFLVSKMMKPATKKAKAASGTGSTDTTPVQVSDSDINQLIDSLISKNIKDAPVNPSNGTQVKAAVSKFSDKEKGILFDLLSVYDELPAYPTTQQISDMLPSLTALSN